MAQDNQTILANAWIEGSNDFQQRIPDPTQGTIAATIDAIFAPMNNRYYNEFVDILINRIGYTYVHQQQFRNPLAAFKKEFMYYGSTVQETFFKWIKAHSYDDASETLLKLRRPEAEVCYHTVNRQDRYAISVVRQELQQAAAEEYGLNRYIAGIMDIPMNSDEYDEYQIMKNLIAFYENSWGFFKVSGTVPSDEASAKALLKSIRTYSGKMRFPSSLYNAAIVQDIPVFVNNPSELVLLVTPEVQASLDVDALAVLFNVERAEVQSRIVIVDEFPIPGAYALLTTDEFFQCRDTLYENASFYNAETLSVNYFLHHWGVYSVSPFVPAILFTTEAGSSTPTITVTPQTLAISAAADSVQPGGTVQLSAAFTGNTTANTAGITVQPQAAMWKLSAVDAESRAINLNTRTYVDRLGVLHVQKSMEAGSVITINASAVYVNPSGATEEIQAAPITVNVTNGDAGLRLTSLYLSLFASNNNLVGADEGAISGNSVTFDITASGNPATMVISDPTFSDPSYEATTLLYQTSGDWTTANDTWTISYEPSLKIKFKDDDENESPVYTVTVNVTV